MTLGGAAAALHLSFSVQPLQSARTLGVCAAGALVFVFCARVAVGNDRARRAAWIALAAAGTILSLHGLWQSLLGFQQLAGDAGLPEAMRARLASGRAVSTLGLPGALAGFLALSLPVTLSISAHARAARRRVPTATAVTAALLQAAALVATRSAAAMVALALATACVAWSLARTAAGRRVAIAALVFGIALAGGILAWRLGSATGTMEGAGPLVLRAGNWKVALAMAADRPLFGGGLGTYGILFPSYRTWEMNESRFAHNTWLQIAAEAGAPAGLAALALGAWLVVRLLRRGDGGGAGRYAGAVACLAFLAHNAADFTFYLPSVALPFFCLAGFEIGRAGGRPAAAGGARTARLLACAVLAALALWVSRGDARRDAARDLASIGTAETQAVAAARDAVTLNPIDPEAHDLLARLLLQQAVASRDTGPLVEAESHASRAVDLDEMTPGHWNLLGRVRLARSDPQGAYIALHRAAQLYPIRIEYRQDRDAVAAMLSRSAGSPGAVPPPSEGAPR